MKKPIKDLDAIRSRLMSAVAFGTVFKDVTKQL